MLGKSRCTSGAAKIDHARKEKYFVYGDMGIYVKIVNYFFYNLGFFMASFLYYFLFFICWDEKI